MTLIPYRSQQIANRGKCPQPAKHKYTALLFLHVSYMQLHAGLLFSLFDLYKGAQLVSKPAHEHSKLALSTITPQTPATIVQGTTLQDTSAVGYSPLEIKRPLSFAKSRMPPSPQQNIRPSQKALPPFQAETRCLLAPYHPTKPLPPKDKGEILPHAYQSPHLISQASTQFLSS